MLIAIRLALSLIGAAVLLGGGILLGKAFDERGSPDSHVPKPLISGLAAVPSPEFSYRRPLPGSVLGEEASDAGSGLEADGHGGEAGGGAPLGQSTGEEGEGGGAPSGSSAEGGSDGEKAVQPPLDLGGEQ